MNERMKESLGVAAEIREQLKGRQHSESTELVRAERDFEEILRAALLLSPNERAMLADHLLASLDSPNQKEIDAAWAEEAERRMREIDEGKAELIDGDTVMRELRTRFKKL
jgi:putative addiction module component (TIGR02574 family)